VWRLIDTYMDTNIVSFSRFI